MNRTSLNLTILLVVSVSINLAIAGVMFGNHLRRPPPQMINDRVAHYLPQSVRDAVHEQMQADKDRVREQMRLLRTARKDVADALRTRPFDATQADATLARLRNEMAQAQTNLHATIIAQMKAAQEAGTLPPPPQREKKNSGKGKPDKADEADTPPPPG